MTTKVSQWHRIAMLAAGISTSMASMAWGQNLYQTHYDGSIWEYTGTPCTHVSCPGWIELDNNPNMYMIAAGGGALFEMHYDSTVWWYTGTPCSGGSCPGWVQIDNMNAVMIGTGGGLPYEGRSDGTLWQWNGVICTGGDCPGWTELSDVGDGVSLGANTSLLVELGGDVTGPAPLWMFDGMFDGWVQIDLNVAGYAVGANTLYDLRVGGLVQQYTASPITYSWLTIDDTKTTVSITAGGSGLYQQRMDASIWQYTGTPCNGTTCPGWVLIDKHPGSTPPVAGSNTVYQVRESGSGSTLKRSIWQYTGTPCSEGVCSGWVALDTNPNTKSLVAGPANFITGSLP